jgi:diguanylate cyclase (GGDEF)-like protein
MKRVNDQAGHLAGGRLSMAVARLLETTVPDSDIAARWGGDEFAILLSGADRSDAMRIAGEILDGIRQLGFRHDDNADPVTASIGVTEASVADTLESFASRADNAACAAKRAGRNRVTYQPPPDLAAASP